jgi:hypothetical protein
VAGCWLFYLFFELPFIPKRAPQDGARAKKHAPSGLPLRPYSPGK